MKSALSRPFAIGLQPLGNRPWLIIDDRLPHYLDEKKRLYESQPEQVFRAESRTGEAQQETFERICTFLGTETPVSSAQAETSEAALVRAGMMVAEDLVLMRKSDDGWRLVAGMVCFPSSWNLADKFCLPMDEIHRPVPGFGSGSRNAMLIERIFDNLAPDQPVLRGNWSLYDDMQLHHLGQHGILSLAEPKNLVLREERQTLVRLPRSGDILFTILITLTPVHELKSTEMGRSTVRTLREHIAGMSDDETSYKGMAKDRKALLDFLRA